MVWFILNEAHEKALKEITAAKSDRVTVVLGAAMLDDLLREILTSRFKDSSLVDSAFSGGGFLGTAVAKIDLAYLMHAIDKPSLKALRGIAAIRNIFAHNLDATFDLQSKKMNDAFSALTLHSDRTTYVGRNGDDTELPIGTIGTRRRQFEVNLQLVLPKISDDLFARHYPHSSIPLDTMRELIRNAET